MKHIIGISIGGTKSAVCYATIENDEVISVTKKQTPSLAFDPDTNIKNIIDLIDTFPQDFEYISVIGCSPMDVEKGILCSPPNLKGWVDYPLLSKINEKYNRPIALLNDADASAFAEWKFGAGRGTKNFIYVTVGTGLGCGLVLNGKLYTGFKGNAGELGHVKISDENYVARNGKFGAAEGYASGGGLADYVSLRINEHKDSSLSSLKNITTKDIFEAARNGDSFACEMVEVFANKLGESIAILLDLLNPECVAIGGIYPRTFDLIGEKVLDSVKRNSLKINYESCRIVPSILDEKIDDYSSLMNYYNK